MDRNGSGIDLLADPTRRRIVALVAERPRRPSALADLVGVSRPAISRQLRLLVEAGVLVRVSLTVDGRGALITLNTRRVGAVVAWLAGTEIGGPFPGDASAGTSIPDG